MRMSLQRPTPAPSVPLLRPQMPELDTLRGIAVSLVVCFHSFGFTYGFLGLPGVPKILVALTMPGWIGVNLFFVLSGFLITGILLDTKMRPDYYRRFYVRRALRILPLYYAVLVLLLVLARSGLVERRASWSFLALSSVYLANVTELLGVPMQYGVLWSLAVEEHFYLLWPGLVRRLSRRNVILCAASVALLCLSLRVLYYVFGFATGGYTWLSADGLALGAILAAVARNPEQSRRGFRRVTVSALLAGTGLFAAGAPFGIFLARHFLGVTFRETALDLLCTGVVGTTLLLGTSEWKAVVNRPVLQFLGRISYGVYLTHMLIFEVVAHFLGRLWPGLPLPETHFAVMVLHFAISGSLTLGLMSLSRRYFEGPFLALKDRHGSSLIPVPVQLIEPHSQDSQLQSA
jgi:peptidoglycan/LPS O-acetylase OafA/YrhL